MSAALAHTIYGLKVPACGEFAVTRIGSQVGLLLRFFMELLRFLLQLLKAAFGIYVDGVLCDFALHAIHISRVPDEARKRAQSVDNHEL